MSDIVWGYGFKADMDHWIGMEPTAEAALEEARLDAAEQGHTGPVYIIQGYKPNARGMFHEDRIAEDVLERAACFAYDNYSAEDEFPDVSKEAEAELAEAIGKILDEWVPKHVEVNFWTADGETEVLPGESWEDARQRENAKILSDTAPREE